MESWRQSWRKGFAPLLKYEDLKALEAALESDDSRLIQGATTTPPPLHCVQDWPVEAACALGYCGWKGRELGTVGEVEEFFARACCDADLALGEPAGCRWFLNWWDQTPREELRREMLPEVRLSLANLERQQAGASDCG